MAIKSVVIITIFSEKQDSNSDHYSEELIPNDQEGKISGHLSSSKETSVEDMLETKVLL